MTADPRSSKHCKLCRFEIKSMQLGSQIYVPIDRYSLSLSIKLEKHEKRPQNVIAMHAGKGPYSSCVGKHDGRYQEYVFKPKTSSRFPNFEASNAWQMGHNSQEGFFLGQELLLDLTAWINLTSNADNTITVYQLPSKFQNTF